MGQLNHIYCDESRQTAHRYMVLGGLILHADEAPVVASSIGAFRNEWMMSAELKWTKVSKGKIDAYKGYVDLFAKLNAADKVHYHAMILDTHQFDHNKFNKGNKEIGFYKFYYQLLLHSFGRRYCRKNEDDRFLVFLDHRQTSYKLGTLKNTLNHGIKKKYGVDHQPWRNVEPRDSKKVEFLQMVDILTGAIGFVKNGYAERPDSSPAKKDLAAHIGSRMRHPILGNNTSWGRNCFTVWNFKLRK